MRSLIRHSVNAADDMSEPLLKVRDLTVRFRSSAGASLEGVSFDLQQGEAVALIGESGAGKTTLARALVRVLPASAQVEGQVRIGGVDLLAASNKAVRRIQGARVSFIPQEPELALNPVMRVRDQVEEVVRAHQSLRRQDRINRAEAALAATGLPEGLGRSYPHQLSGGQRQRVAIAQALVARPDLLIADEPTSALDTVLQAEILSLVKDLILRFEIALICITHDPVLVRGLADRALVLCQGHLVESGSLEQILREPHHPSTAKLVRSIVPLRSGASRVAGSDAHEKTNHQHKAILEVQNLSKIYSKKGLNFRGRSETRALNRVSLRLPHGATLALIGKSGSGKSTLARCLTMLEKPDSGEIRLQNQPMQKRSRSELRRLRREIQLVWQHSALALNPRFRAIDIVAEPLRIQKLASKTEARKRAAEMMERLGLPATLSQRTSFQLSGGQRQRLALARALVVCPSVLILDEAFAGLDLPLQSEIASMLLELRSSLSLSYIFITHDLRRAASFADQLLVMQDGNVVEQGAPEALISSPEHEATRQLVAAALLT